MTISASSLLVTIVFAAQILVLSVLVPSLFRKSHSALKVAYPPSEYPRLYPVPLGDMERYYLILFILRVVVVVVSTTIFGIELIEGHEAAVLARTLIWVLLAQEVVPALIRLPWQLRMARAFRALPPPQVRSADLRPLRITEFVPLPLIAAGITGAAVSMGGAVILFARDPGASRMVALYVLTVSGCLLWRMLATLRSPGSMPRPDPYMTDADVFRTRRARLRMLFSVAAVAGTAVCMLLLFKAGRLSGNIVAVCISCSILCQLGYIGVAQFVLRTLTVRDAGVYRVEAT